MTVTATGVALGTVTRKRALTYVPVVFAWDTPKNLLHGVNDYRLFFVDLVEGVRALVLTGTSDDNAFVIFSVSDDGSKLIVHQNTYYHYGAPLLASALLVQGLVSSTKVPLHIVSAALKEKKGIKLVAPDTIELTEPVFGIAIKVKGEKTREIIDVLRKYMGLSAIVKPIIQSIHASLPHRKTVDLKRLLSKKNADEVLTDKELIYELARFIREPVITIGDDGTLFAGNAKLNDVLKFLEFEDHSTLDEFMDFFLANLGSELENYLRRFGINAKVSTDTESYNLVIKGDVELTLPLLESENLYNMLLVTDNIRELIIALAASDTFLRFKWRELPKLFGYEDISSLDMREVLELASALTSAVTTAKALIRSGAVKKGRNHIVIDTDMLRYALPTPGVIWEVIKQFGFEGKLAEEIENEYFTVSEYMLLQGLPLLETHTSVSGITPARDKKKVQRDYLIDNIVMDKEVHVHTPEEEIIIFPADKIIIVLREDSTKSSVDNKAIIGKAAIVIAKHLVEKYGNIPTKYRGRVEFSGQLGKVLNLAEHIYKLLGHNNIVAIMKKSAKEKADVIESIKRILAGTATVSEDKAGNILVDGKHLYEAVEHVNRYIITILGFNPVLSALSTAILNYLGEDFIEHLDDEFRILATEMNISLPPPYYGGAFDKNAIKGEVTTVLSAILCNIRAPINKENLRKLLVLKLVNVSEHMEKLVRALGRSDPVYVENGVVEINYREVGEITEYTLHFIKVAREKGCNISDGVMRCNLDTLIDALKEYATSKRIEVELSDLIEVTRNDQLRDLIKRVADALKAKEVILGDEVWDIIDAQALNEFAIFGRLSSISLPGDKEALIAVLKRLLDLKALAPVYRFMKTLPKNDRK